MVKKCSMIDLASLTCFVKPVKFSSSLNMPGADILFDANLYQVIATEKIISWRCFRFFHHIPVNGKK
jgi:hypothetical protein